jgi:hypothetical protein
MLVWADNTDYQESDTLHLARHPRHKSTDFASDEELSQFTDVVELTFAMLE